MLLSYDPAAPFSEKRRKRLLFLERHVHQRIESRATALITAPALRELLFAAGVPEPGEYTERRALERDLDDYATLCDDFVPTRQITGGRPVGGSSVGYALDVGASRDAIRYFLGEPWLQTALQPRLSSAIARCFLLAMAERREVEFEYRRVPRAGESWVSHRLRGVPLHVVPGLDSAYFQLLGEQGRFNVNLARVAYPVFWTDHALAAPPAEPLRQVKITLRFEQVEDARALVETFTGLRREDSRTASIVVPEALATMTADRLAAYLYRTRERPGEQEQCALAGNAVMIRSLLDDSQSE